jgi:dTDP-4-dehydrorhamnose 3,5-epimerase
MIFKETSLKGAYIIEPELIEDERGFFARTFCINEFQQNGLKTDFVQCNISFNQKAGTLRGLHYQDYPWQETKLVRCTSGAVYDVIIDLRKNSVTYCQWLSFNLSAENHKMLYIPEGFAHGFQTLEANTEIFYQISQVYQPEFARGIKWDDPLFNISWPAEEKIISKKDNSYKAFQI